jgi:hypothetical protein
MGWFSRTGLALLCLSLASTTLADSKLEVADFCQADANGQYPSSDFVVAESGDSPFSYASAGGCILRPLQDVWAISQKSRTWAWGNSDQEAFNATKLTSTPAQGTHAQAFLGSYAAGPFFARQRWTMRFDLQWSTGMQQIDIAYQKTRGTQHIPLWRGWVQMKQLAQNVVAFGMRDELSATQCNSRNCLQTIRDVLTHLRTDTP